MQATQTTKIAPHKVQQYHSGRNSKGTDHEAHLEVLQEVMCPFYNQETLDSYKVSAKLIKAAQSVIDPETRNSQSKEILADIASDACLVLEKRYATFSNDPIGLAALYSHARMVVKRIDDRFKDEMTKPGSLGELFGKRLASAGIDPVHIMQFHQMDKRMNGKRLAGSKRTQKHTRDNIVSPVAMLHTLMAALEVSGRTERQKNLIDDMVEAISLQLSLNELLGELIERYIREAERISFVSSDITKEYAGRAKAYGLEDLGFSLKSYSDIGTIHIYELPQTVRDQYGNEEERKILRKLHEFIEFVECIRQSLGIVIRPVQKMRVNPADNESEKHELVPDEFNNVVLFFNRVFVCRYSPCDQSAKQFKTLISKIKSNAKFEISDIFREGRMKSDYSFSLENIGGLARLNSFLNGHPKPTAQEVEKDVCYVISHMLEEIGEFERIKTSFSDVFGVVSEVSAELSTRDVKSDPCYVDLQQALSSVLTECSYCKVSYFKDTLFHEAATCCVKPKGSRAPKGDSAKPCDVGPWKEIQGMVVVPQDIQEARVFYDTTIRPDIERHLVRLAKEAMVAMKEDDLIAVISQHAAARNTRFDEFKNGIQKRISDTTKKRDTATGGEKDKAEKALVVLQDLQVAFAGMTVATMPLCVRFERKKWGDQHIRALGDQIKSHDKGECPCSKIGKFMAKTALIKLLPASIVY